MKTRIVSWAFGFLMMILAFWYFPTWRECAVFMVAYTVCAFCNTMTGFRMGAAEFKSRLLGELDRLDKTP